MFDAKKPFVRKNGYYYFPKIEDATSVQNNLYQQGFTNTRLVHFEHGWAIQREKSGPYWGEPNSFGCARWK